jgi:hypothetical protein
LKFVEDLQGEAIRLLRDADDARSGLMRHRTNRGRLSGLRSLRILNPSLLLARRSK